MSAVKGSTEIVLYQNPDKTVVLITAEQCDLALKLIKEYNSSLAAQTRKELNDSGKIFTIYVFSGAGVGFVVGGGIGIIGGPGAFVTVPACAAVGGMIGTLVGTCVGVYKAYFSNNSQWATWREKQTRETMRAFLEIFQDNFEDGALEKLNIVDEYDYSIMDNPCVDHCTSAQAIGHVHNFSSWNSYAA